MNISKNIFFNKKNSYMAVAFLVIFTILSYYLVLYSVSLLSSEVMILHIANRNKALAERIALLSGNHLVKNSSANQACIKANLETDLQLLRSANKALSCAKKNTISNNLNKKIESLYTEKSVNAIDKYILSGEKILTTEGAGKSEELLKILSQVKGHLQDDLQKIISSHEMEVANAKILVKNTEKIFSVLIWLIIASVILNNLAKIKKYSNNRKILIVEDNRVGVELIKKIIENKGYDTVIANNGQEALDVLNTDRNFILVLMDCEMPIMGGFEATTVIRNTEKEKKLPKIPIIALTANVMQGDKERCLACGMDDYLGKPVDFNELEKVIDKWSNKNKEG